MVEYIIIEERRKDEVVKLVNEKISQGWTLQGGINFAGRTDRYNTRYSQAMIKIKETKIVI